MVQGNRKEISLYEEAKAGLNSLIQQTATVFVGFVIMLLVTGGVPSGFELALSFCLGTAFVAWSEQKRLEKLRTPTQTIASEILGDDAQQESPSKEDSVSKDSKYTVTAEHIINTISDSILGHSRSGQSGQTNYNSARGDIINQSGSFVTGVAKSKTQINNLQNLTQAAKDIKALLDQLSVDYPNDSPRVLSAKAVDEIEKNPELKSLILQGVKAGSFAALEKMIDHPIAKFFIEGAKEGLKP